MHLHTICDNPYFYEAHVTRNLTLAPVSRNSSNGIMIPLMTSARFSAMVDVVEMTITLTPKKIAMHAAVCIDKTFPYYYGDVDLLFVAYRLVCQCPGHNRPYMPLC